MKFFFLFCAIILFAIGFPLVQSYALNIKNDGSININKELEVAFLQDMHSEAKTLVLFFGYVGCVDVCTPILETLGNLYSSEDLKEKQDKVQIVFVNLTAQLDAKQVKLFAKSFHKDFEGIYLTQHQLYRIDRSFSVYFADTFSNKEALLHTDYVYLLQKKDSQVYLLKNMYTSHPINEEVLLEDILISLGENS